MIVIKDVSRTNSLWDLGSWAVKCIFLRQLWDCQEDAVTMTVTINNLQKGCDWVFFFLHIFVVAISTVKNINSSSVSKNKKEGKKKTQVGKKQETKTPLIYVRWMDSIIKWLWIFFFLCMLAWIFHKRCIWKVHQNKLFDFDNYYNNGCLRPPHLFENE